ncbi:MAG: hypothetical protein FWF23_01815 [Alphaproteobacteria bacterium]|nr:hypothetical protein [Alphaproteobacteria bacterium]MCL2505997.1 hypothetical protein [Alphaproteobacteria bacterium]
MKIERKNDINSLIENKNGEVYINNILPSIFCDSSYSVSGWSATINLFPKLEYQVIHAETPKGIFDVSRLQKGIDDKHYYDCDEWYILQKNRNGDIVSVVDYEYCRETNYERLRFIDYLYSIYPLDEEGQKHDSRLCTIANKINQRLHTNTRSEPLVATGPLSVLINAPNENSVPQDFHEKFFELYFQNKQAVKSFFDTTANYQCSLAKARQYAGVYL